MINRGSRLVLADRIMAITANVLQIWDDQLAGRDVRVHRIGAYRADLYVRVRVGADRMNVPRQRLLSVLTGHDAVP